MIGGAGGPPAIEAPIIFRRQAAPRGAAIETQSVSMASSGAEA